MGKKSRKSKQKHKPKGDGVAPAAASSPAAARGSATATSSPASSRADAEPPTPPRGAVCWICLDGDPDEGGNPIARDCACRGDDAGFAHLSCLVNYAETKSRELIAKGGDGGKIELRPVWEDCPTCRQLYQRQVGIDMAKAYVSFVEENAPEPPMKTLKLVGLKVLLERIMDMYVKGSSALREEGRRVANQILSEIEGFDKITKEHYSLSIKDIKMLANGALGILSSDGTKEGDELFFQYEEKVQNHSISNGDEASTVTMGELLKIIKAKRDGKADFPSIQPKETLKNARNQYKRILRECGDDAAHATKRVQVGLFLADVLYHAGCGLECERLYTELEAIGRRVLGPDHPLTMDVISGLVDSRRRKVRIMTHGSMVEYIAVGFNDDTGAYTVEGTFSVHGTDQFQIDMFEVAIGTPVICHGLKNANHLNGKIGDVIRYGGAGRYQVRFEDKSLKPASVKAVNLRILFDLPDK